MDTDLKENRQFSWGDGLALVALALGIAVRVWGAWSARCITDPDSSVVALMARHMAELKEFPIFFYGQAYMGSLEPMASALMIRLLGATGFAVSLGPVLFAAAALFFLWRWARDAAGPWGGLAALLAGLFGPLTYFLFQIAPRGGYMVALFVDALAIFAAARMAARLHEGRPVGWGRYLALGLLAGIGMWSNLIVAPALLVAALLLAQGMRWRMGRHLGGIAAGVAGFCAGFSPWIAYNARHGWASLDMSQISGHEPIARALLSSWNRFLMLHEAYKTPVGPHLPLTLTVAMLALAAMGVGLAIAQVRRATPRENFARAGALLFCAVFVWVFVTSGFTRTHTARYWVPVVPGLAVLAAVACAAPGRLARRGAAWILLAALVLVQGFLAVSTFREHGRRSGPAQTAFREIGEVLDRAGVDALLAPVQQYPLNFALEERVAVSDGKQKFYEPILRRAELSEAPAYASDYKGIEVFLRQQGATWESASAGGRGFLWNARRSAVSLREIPSGRIARLRDGLDASQRDVLTDRNLDTWWSPAVGREGDKAAMLEWTFETPQDVRSVQLVFAHGMSDEAFDFPRQIQIEAKEAGEWRTVRTEESIIPLEWSGFRTYHPSGLARLEYRVDAQAAEALRVGLLDTQMQNRKLRWRLSEAILFGAEAGMPPTMDAAAVEILGEWLRRERAEAVVYAPRWVSNQLLKRGWVGEERLAGLAHLVFGARSIPRDGTLDAGKECVFIVDPRFADATRSVLTEQRLPFSEESIAAWNVFTVAADGWHPDGLNLPPAARWTGDGLLAGNTTAHVKEALRRLRAGGDPEMSRRALLQEMVHWRPSALSALTEDEVAHLGGEAAVQARQDAAQFPKTPCATEFANGIRLEGVEIDSSTASAGGEVVLRLYWSASENFEAGDEVVFIHLRDGRGKVVAQGDYRGSLLLWGSPTVRPVAGECVQEVRQIFLPSMVAPGPLSLSIGLYHPGNGRRVPVRRSEAPEVRRKSATWPERIRIVP